jgi:hypothetical protein
MIRLGSRAAAETPDELAPPRLTAHDLAAFRRQGFLVLRHLTTTADVERIREIVLDLYARFGSLPAGHTVDLGDDGRPTGQGQIPEINWAARLAPALRRTLACRRARQIAAQLLGRPVEATGYDHAILKPPFNRRETPWHQDEAYTSDRGVFGSVHVWIPLQDVTAAMGCMEFVPGSHTGLLLPHHRKGRRASAHALETEQVDAAQAVVCPLRVGEATVHLPRTLHRTGPNLTAVPRLAWSVEFGPPARPTWRRWLRPR